MRNDILNAPIFDAREHGDEDEKYTARIAALAASESRAYDAQRQAIKKDFGVRTSTIDDDVKRYRRQLKIEPVTPAEPDIEHLAASAKDVIECKDVLTMFTDECSQVIAGEESLIKLLYLSGTSRLFQKAMHTAVKGPSSGGKSEIRRRVLGYFPPESVFEFTMLSERALLYVKDDFTHKILSMGEAFDAQEVKFQDYILRELMSEGVLRYPVVQKQPDGTMETITIEKRGPVAFMVTTTRNKLHQENETRMLSIEVDDSAKQTRQVIEMVAEVEGLNSDVASADQTRWHDFQRWLAAGECRVKVPFARELAKLMKQTRSVRLRRDFGQLLRAVKAHALLHRQHRRRNKHGLVIAEIEQDYEPSRRLLGEVLATASEMKTRKTIKETVEAVSDLESIDDRYSREVRQRGDSGGVGVHQIADKLKLDKTTAYRRLQAAEVAGLVVNLEERPRRPGRYVTTDENLGSHSILPKTGELRDAYDEARQKRLTSFSSFRSCPR